MMNSNRFNYKNKNYIITINNINKHIFCYNNNISLLSILEKNSINIEFQCRSGYCGMCRIQLLKGAIYYPTKKPIASSCNEKDIFPCCCQPKSNINISI